ncbi:MAG: hypothetical protein ACK47F_00975, partial [Flavobacteriales bacterium]
MIRSSQHSSNLHASSWRKAVRGLVVCLGVVVVLLGSGKVWGQTTYYWIGGTTAASTAAAAKWSTSLGGASAGTIIPSASNIFIINGSDISSTAGAQTGTVTITETGAISMGQFKIINNANVIINSNNGTARVFTIGATSSFAGDDFVIQSGSALTMNNATNEGQIVFAGTGNTGDISGTLTLGGSID